jgi:hypothetical protein
MFELPLSKIRSTAITLADRPHPELLDEEGSAKVTVVRLYDVSARTEVLVSGSIGVVAGVAVATIGSPSSAR